MEGGTLHAPDEVVSRGIERLLEASGAVERLVLSGSPTVDLPPHILEAAREAVAKGGYAPSMGEPELREAIAAQLRGEGIDADPEAVLITNGAMQALDLSFRTLLNHGGGVAIPQPGFFIGGLVDRAGGALHAFPSVAEKGFRPDWHAGTKAVGPSTRILFVNTPVNPTGYVFDEEDLARALDMAARNDLWIVSDESYSHFVYDGRTHRSVASLPGARERTILIRSFSKDYAMAGWRLGYMLLPPALIDAIARTFEWSSLCVSRVSQATGLAALTGPGDWISRFVEEAERRVAWVTEAINAIPGLRCPKPVGGLNILIGYDGDTDRLVGRLITEQGVAVHPGQAFGSPGWFRFQFGSSDDVLRQALGRVREAVETM